jgi:hypothetical protein
MPASNNPPTLPPTYLRLHICTTTSSLFLLRVSLIILPGLASNTDPPDLCLSRITGRSHQHKALFCSLYLLFLFWEFVLSFVSSVLVIAHWNICLFIVLKIISSALCMLGKHCTTELHPQPIFMMVAWKSLSDSTYSCVILILASVDCFLIQIEMFSVLDRFWVVLNEIWKFRI